MKKKTVITIEKHEVWIIRRPAGERPEYETDVTEDESSANSLPALLDEHSEADASLKQD